MQKIVLVLIFITASLFANAQYAKQGKIEFERKVNIKRMMDDLDDEQKQWMERFKAQIPQFNISYFDLYFTTTQSIYKPGREAESDKPKMWFAQSPANDNIVFTDYNSEKVKANKTVYEQKFLIQDTMRKIEWKIADEMRTIANYRCRKAVGKMFDSVYVVAYYTDDITVSGGPEMFGGLPGMILQLAIPRLHTTWIAQTVDIAKPKDTDFVVPEKGKKVNNKEMAGLLKDSFKDWGKYAEKNLWWTLL